MNAKTKEILEKQIQNFGITQADFQVKSLKDKIEEINVFLEKFEEAQNDTETEDFEKISEMLYQLDWMQNSIMRMYQESIKMTATLNEAKALARVIEIENENETQEKLLDK